MRRIFEKHRSPFFLLTVGLIWLLSSCSSSKDLTKALRKHPPEALRQDYDYLRDALERFHPSLYWYTTPDSLSALFDHYRLAISDSMTEQQFGFRVMAPVITSIRCGHTSFAFSKSYNSLFRNLALPSFPLQLKIWGDTMLVTSNYWRGDTVLKKGTQILSINGLTPAQLTGTMFRYMPTDGYADNINYIRLSQSFPYYHRNIFGLSRKYQISYLDSLNRLRETTVPLYFPSEDTLLQQSQTKSSNSGRSASTGSNRSNPYRTFEVDSALRMAVMRIYSFDNGHGLRRFYRKSFRKIKKQGLENLVIDLRNNGGGNVNHYVRLARYIRHTPFRVADSAYAVRQNFGAYGKQFQHRLLNGLALRVFTSRDSQKRYHFRYWEKHEFQPKEKNHFNGQVYVLMGGPTFSAATLFCHTVSGQQNIRLVGEETGGAAYGNSGLMIPYLTLPNSKMRVSIPLFRLVQYEASERTGRGVMPDIPVPPVSTAVRQGVDLKMEKVRELVRKSWPVTQRSD